MALSAICPYAPGILPVRSRTDTDAVRACPADPGGWLSTSSAAPQAYRPQPPTSKPTADRQAGPTPLGHAMVHELPADGHGIRTIAQHLGWGRHTVQRRIHHEMWADPRSWIQIPELTRKATM
jgi:hypothetical protein